MCCGRNESRKPKNPTTPTSDSLEGHSLFVPEIALTPRGFVSPRRFHPKRVRLELIGLVRGLSTMTPSSTGHDQGC